jgi:hypothetical protein
LGVGGHRFDDSEDARRAAGCFSPGVKPASAGRGPVASVASCDSLASPGTIQWRWLAAGSQAKLDEMLSHLDNFEFWFDIVTP